MRTSGGHCVVATWVKRVSKSLGTAWCEQRPGSTGRLSFSVLSYIYISCTSANPPFTLYKIFKPKMIYSQNFIDINVRYIRSLNQCEKYSIPSD